MDTHLSANRPYGQCSTYFTETDDNDAHIQRQQARKRAQAVARQTQRNLAEELSNVTCDEYQDEILNCMEQMESETLPDTNSIDIQTEIQWFMRPFLMDFLIEAHAAFQLLPDTLYLTVNLMDRYCSRRVVYKRHYQLVGCAALLIAAKYGDRKDKVPTIRELKSMCCSLYEEEMFTQMEWHVLVTLNWVVGHPTVDSFLQIALSGEPSDPEAEHLTWYICEMAIFHRNFVSTPPSVMARSALGLARYILQRPLPEGMEWDEYYACLTFLALVDMVQCDKSSVLANKYSSPRLSSVSQSLELYLMQQAQLHRQQENATPAYHDGVEKQQYGQTSHTMPHTPQKDQGLSSVSYGYATPPVTPEGFLYSVDATGKPLAPWALGSTLTPPVSANHCGGPPPPYIQVGKYQQSSTGPYRLENIT